MAVQFILGENPNKKRKLMIDNIYYYLENHPDAELIYLVPDNVKYEAETMVLEQFKEKKKDTIAGIIRLQIFSFSRLAWYFLQDQAIYQKPQLTESGLAMLLERILKEEEENLTIFRGASQERGFIQRLIALFSEFRNGKIHPNDLEEILLTDESLEGEKDFEKKIEHL
ncbi:MAG: helicase-exonuclease AddAB subunit AddB, partial [Atopostipes sp.]|nr:helicase-exonuclease AddAB subunit AddB [Atopostipes sp.]